MKMSSCTLPCSSCEIGHTSNFVPVFYTTRIVDPKLHSIPSSLDREFVISVLHNEAAMRQMLSLPGGKNTTKESTWTDVLASMAFPLSAPDPTATLSLTALPDGVSAFYTLTGCKITNNFRVVGGGQSAEEAEDKSGAGLQLQLDGSSTILKIFSSWVVPSSDPRPPRHVARLLVFFEELVRNGRDVEAALQSEALAGVDKEYARIYENSAPDENSSKTG